MRQAGGKTSWEMRDDNLEGTLPGDATLSCCTAPDRSRSPALKRCPFYAAPTHAAANDKYPEDAFRQKDEGGDQAALWTTAEPSENKIKLDAPEIAENGAVVPISVSTSLADVTTIAFVVPENPNVLAAYYKIPQGTMPNVANRLKYGEDQQRHRNRRIRRQTFQRDQGSQSHRRRLRRLNMASSIRVRAIANGETTEVQTLIQHPMDLASSRMTRVHSSRRISSRN